MDRKRPLLNESEDSDVKLPPGKIIKTELDSIDNPNNIDISSLITLDSPEDYLLAYQKEAIWRRMEKYKREANQKQEFINSLQSKQQKYLDKFMIIGKYWLQIEEEINLFSLKTGNQDNNEVDNLDFLKKIYQYDDDKEKLDNFEKIFSNYLNKLRNSISSLNEKKLGKTISENEIINNLEKKYKTSSDNALKYQSELEESQNQISNLENQLDDLNIQYTILENKLNKKKCLTTSAQLSTMNKDSAINHNSSSDVKDEVNVTKLNEDLNIANARSQSRLKEIQDLESEKIKLVNEVNKLKIQLIEIPDEVIIESAPYKNLQLQCNFLKSDSDNSKIQLEKITREYESLKSTRQSFMEQVEQEEIKRRKSLEEEIRKLEQDIVRLQSEKDTFQQALELRNSKDQTEIYQNHEIRIIANTRKDRIICLEKQIQRLRMTMATNAGDKELLEMHDESTADEIIQKLRNSITELQKDIEEKNLKIKAFETATNKEINIQEISLSNELLKKEIKELNEKIKSYEDLYGITENSNADDATKEIAIKLRELEEQKKQLELKCTSHEKICVKLLAEIEKIGAAWQELENQNSRKVLDLTEKEVQIVKLIAEKTKYDQKCHTLMKDKTVSNNLIIALKRQSDKQLELIRKLEDHEKNLTNLLSTEEKKTSNYESSIEAHKKKALESIESYNEMKEKYDRLNRKLIELNNIIKEKSVSLEIELSQNRRLQEEVNISKKKIESLSKYENSGDSNLQKQLDEYKALLKCPSCNIRFKSHVLTRCMHVFCKECIKSRTESRQRKCPTCGESFGYQDYKQIWL